MEALSEESRLWNLGVKPGVGFKALRKSSASFAVWSPPAADPRLLATMGWIGTLSIADAAVLAAVKYLPCGRARGS